MKKLFKIAASVAAFLFIAVLIIKPATAQKSDGGSKPIPDDVMKIVKRSCIACHSKTGKNMAIAFVSFTKWNEYSPKKQAAKSNTMCKMVSKDKMPPRNYRKSFPEVILTKDEVKKICDWAQTLQVTKK